MKLKRIAASAVVLVLFTNLSFADDLYKAKLANGSVLYSSKKKSTDAEIAELPKISREPAKKNPADELNYNANDSSSTNAATKSKPDTSCVTHGGVRCEDGPDLDGSVICSDGYRDSQIRFNFSCRSTKLSVVTAGMTEPETLKIVVRNERAVNATTVSVTVKIKGELGDPDILIVAVGPADIMPNQAGDYLAKSSKFKDIKREYPVDNIEVSCGNCG